MADGGRLLARARPGAGLGGGPYVEFPYDPPGWTEERRDFFLTAPVRIDAEGYLTVPAVADRVRAAAGKSGAGPVAVLGAPVSGMAAGAQAGTLQIFVGGEQAVFERVRPLLAAMGDPGAIVYAGGHGGGLHG